MRELMREIGGYLRLDTYKLPMLHEGAIALNSGRNCLAYLIQKRNIKKIYLPKYLCASVSDICKNNEVEIKYYSIDMHFLPLIKGVSNDSWVYIVNYYGQLSNDKIRELKRKYSNIIIDNVQAYYQEPCEDTDTIYTCRKFFGVPDGAFLYSNVGLDYSLELDYSWNRIEHIMGSFEKGAAAFYSSYTLAEEEFERIPMRRMSSLTDNFLRAVDYERVKKIRTTNFEYLHKKLNEVNRLKIKVPDGAYMYPLYLENGSEIRKKLQQLRIYIPTLWPDVFELCDEGDVEYDMAKNILPIPVDQRYGTEDMEYIVSNVMKLIER